MRDVEEPVEHGRARREVCIEQVGRRRDDAADKEDRHAAKHGDQHGAEQRAEYRGNDAEEFGGNGDIVQRVAERAELVAEIERIGKRAPDCVREPVGQRQQQDQDGAPFEA